MTSSRGPAPGQQQAILADLGDAIAELTKVVVEYAEIQGSAIRGPIDLVCRLLHLHTEVSELAEACRAFGVESPQVPGMRHVEEELADIFALTLLISNHLKVDLARALQCKLEYCRSHRSRRHGKKW